MTTFQSETGRLLRVIMKHPAQAAGFQEACDADWDALGWLGRPEYDAMCREADALRELLHERDVEILDLPQAPDTGLDSLYARDAAVVSDRGIILGAMGKDARAGEPRAMKSYAEELGLPVLGGVTGEGRIEGGDCVWLDSSTLAVGRGYRTNAEGIRQLRALLEPEATVVEIPSPHFRGPGDVFHLMSMLSPVAPDVAVVYSPTMPVPFREHLLERNWTLVEVPEAEYDTLGPNVLALEPGVALVCEGSPETRRRLQAAGVEVVTFTGNELCVKGSGGPTCLTRTLERES